MVKINYKQFNIFFLTFITFIFFIAVFYLHQKHTDGSDSTISEWMINYQGGFTRRGFIGEICFKIASYFDLNLRYTIFFFQSVLYFAYSILIYFFIKDTPKNILTIIAIFSPIFLLYPVAEIEVLARKEIFLYIGFIIFLNFSAINKSKNIQLIYIFFIFPILCLIWEPFIFFFPFAAIVILIKHNEESLKKNLLKILLSFTPSIVVSIFILLNLLTIEEHEVMRQALMSKFGEECLMSCALLGSKSSVKSQFYDVFILLSFEVIFRYLIIIIIGFSPLFILYSKSRLKIKINFFNSNFISFIKMNNLLLTLFILLIPTLILFSSATDWGRWVNMTYTFSILLYIYLLKNNLLIIDKKVLFFDDFFIYKKKIFITLFIIFAFCWNQKTAMTGDVATNSLYKIIYNTSKRAIGFESIRLFQDNPIIKFHKKYIE